MQELLARRDAAGGTAALRLNIRDQGSFYLRWDMIDTGDRSTSRNRLDPGGTHHALSVGVGTGSVPALITTGAAGLMYAFLIAVYFGYGY